jgi:hypothetical protein
MDADGVKCASGVCGRESSVTLFSATHEVRGAAVSREDNQNTGYCKTCKDGKDKQMME